ncbi:MAG: VWA domain-containing protein [Betaproteobacteria bacterium]
MKPALALVVGCVASLPLAGAAQQAASTQPAATFKAGVELVRLDVGVIGPDGRPIRDLRRNEIQVLEDGRPRPILFFQHIEAPTDPYIEVAARTVAGEVSTNQGAARGHLYVIIFDQENIEPGNEQRARLAAQRFVRTHLRPGDRVALYAVPGPGPELPFTSNVSLLMAGLEQVHGVGETQEIGVFGTMTRHEAFQIVRGDDDVLQRVAQRDAEQLAGTDAGARVGLNAAGSGSTPLSDLVREDARTIVNKADAQSRRVLSMISDILEPMRAVEGRKTVFLISEGFNGDHLARDIERVAAAAAQSYSVIYAMDLNRRGLDASADLPTGGDRAASVLDKIDPLGSLAVETDGALIPDAGSRADQVFDDIAARSQDYYLVGFTPLESALKDPGTYRPIAVRVTRRGARVSTRTGFALVDPGKSIPRREAIERAMAAPFPQQGLPVRYTTYVLRSGSPGMQRVILSLSAELPLASEHLVAPADVVFVVRSVADGRVAASGTDTIPLPERRIAGETTGTGRYHVQFELPAGEYLMRAVVREPGGLVGSADRRFTVQALGGPSVTSGDLVLSAERGELPVRPAAYAGDGLSGVLELYGRTADQLRNARVIVDLAPVGEHAPIVSGFADLGSVVAAGSGVSREARIALPLTGIAPGTYVAHAAVKIGSDTVSEVMREVEIREGSRPAVADDTTEAFDPHEVVNGAFARDYVERTKDSTAPSPTDAREGLARLAAADYPAAIKAFDEALDADSQNAAAAFFLGWAYHGAGDDRQAISAWRRAAYIDPSMVPAHLALADTYLRLSQPGLAVQALRAGLAVRPQSPELLDRLARIRGR